uniref:DUF434 domain-containing protein n=1 Tax=Cyanothece sp. (strain PCC 7425 / ATCC 29141) TaxID=395961 RepID=B8HK41_CYAP4
MIPCLQYPSLQYKTVQIDPSLALSSDSPGPRHRGAHPQDQDCFSPDQWEVLCLAITDLSWLLGRGYAVRSALKLVGDRYELRERQRLAVLRSSCAPQVAVARQQTRCDLNALAGGVVAIDGFNCLITVEAALAGGVLLRGLDGALRDLASVHGSYRRVEETNQAIALLGQILANVSPASVIWFLDRPVSNSGQLRERLLAMAETQDWPWQVELVLSADHAVISSGAIVASSDGPVLDRCQHWVDLPQAVVAAAGIETRVLDFQGCH